MAAMTQLLARAHPPTAVVCSNDLTAIGVLHCLFEAGKQAPADFSVIGFDDVHIAQFMLPPLTTVRMSCADIARAAFATLRHRIEPGSARHAGASRGNKTDRAPDNGQACSRDREQYPGRCECQEGAEGVMERVSLLSKKAVESAVEKHWS